MKKTFNITINVEVDVRKGEDGRRIPWIVFKGWKHGVILKSNRFIETEPMVKMTKENMRQLGEHIFEAAKEMFYEDNDLAIEGE